MTPAVENGGTPAEVEPRGETRSFRLEAIVVFVVALAAYASSLGNKYALDDALVIERNIYVQRGIAGIADILSHDAYQSFYDTMGARAQLAGGRYRPLAAVTFAIEQSLFGETLGAEYERVRAELDSLGAGDPRAFALRETLRELLELRIREAGLAIAPHRHAIQLLLFAGSMVALLAFLRLLLSDRHTVAFVATILFALHPIHSEVVANVKSRDEILSLLFVALAGIALFRHDEKNEPRAMALASLFLALALLSKEYAIVAPLVLGSALVLARGRRPVEVLRRCAPFLTVVACYLALRFLILGETPRPDLATQDVLNDPFLPLRLGVAEGNVLATKLSILPHYLRLLVAPHPLSSDYSYATFPYATFASPAVWLSLALHGLLAALTVVAWRKRHPLAFAGIAYGAFLLPVSNLAFEIGATMGERLAYHASLGFVLVAAWLLVEAPKPLPLPGRLRGAVTWLLVALVALPCAMATSRRAMEWRDDRTLFLADVKTVPRSALANGNAGGEIMSDGLRIVQLARRENRDLTKDERARVGAAADAALVYLRRAVEIHPRFANSWINIGLCLYYKDDLEGAAEAFAKGSAIYSRHPLLEQYGTNFHALGMKAAEEGRLDDGVAMFRRAVAVWPHEIRFWRDYAGAGFVSMHFTESRAAFDRVLSMAPGDAEGTRGRDAAAGMERLETATKERPGDSAALREFASNLRANAIPAFQERASMLELAASMLEQAK